MRHVDRADVHVANGQRVIQQGDRRCRRVAAAPVENIVEAPFERFQAALPGVARHWGAVQVEYLPQIVDTMRVVGMFMRPQHRVEVRHAGIQQLFAHVRSGIDQNRGRLALHQHRRARAPVARILGIACTPVTPDPRHA